MRHPNDWRGKQDGDRLSARATALALRRLAQATRAGAAWERNRATALREVADAYLAEADAVDAEGLHAPWRFLREEAAHMNAMADHADRTAKVLDRQAALAVSSAAGADKRAGEGRPGTNRHARQPSLSPPPAADRGTGLT